MNRLKCNRFSKRKLKPTLTFFLNEKSSSLVGWLVGWY